MMPPRAFVPLAALLLAWARGAADPTCSGDGDDLAACRAGAPVDDEASLLASRRVTAHGARQGWKKGQVYSNKPRIRREWRTLSPEIRQRVADAFWVMKRTLTPEGRAKYGPKFMNYDDILMYHGCALYDPRCDQGHLGPQFITFHRAFLLLVENSLLAVDPKVLALPYWDFSCDAMGGKCAGDPEKFIFTPKFFGNLTGAGQNYQVNDGLFANWPVAEWSSARFGKSSWLAQDPVNTCARQERFAGAQALVCDKCCFSKLWEFPTKAQKNVQCSCGARDTKKVLLRNHGDCTPTTNRWPMTPGFSFKGKVLAAGMPMGINMMGNPQFQLMYNATDYSACADVSKAKTWMEWNNCVEASIPICGDPENILNRPAVNNLLFTMITRTLNAQLGGQSAVVSAIVQEISRDMRLCSKNFTLYGYYDVLLEGEQLDPKSPDFAAWLAKVRHYVHSMHLNVHQWLGLDYSDVASSPNDVGPWTGHHSNIDRSNMEWMHHAKQAGLDAHDYYYPTSQATPPDFEETGVEPTGINGPWSTGSQFLCNTNLIAKDFRKTFTEYKYNNPDAPWTAGTLLNDVVSSGMPFKNLFDCPANKDCSGGAAGYTHKEILHYTSPERTPYTYDTLAYLYGL